MSDAGLAARVDQAGAAAAAATALYAATRARLGLPAEGSLGPIAGRVVMRLADVAATNRLLLCCHLSWGAPSPAMWSPIEGDILRCPSCHAAAEAHLAFAQRNRCAACRGQFHKVKYEQVFLLPAVVALDRSFPPAVCVFDLCHRCHDVDAATGAGS